MITVSIVGVGLIGGSFGLALREAGFAGRLLGVSSPKTIAEARARGAIDEGVSLEAACAQADLIYLSGPIHSILETIPKLDPLVKPGALVTDAGSTKGLIVAAAREHLKRAQFLGGHPMAGKESRGVASAEPGLFRHRPYIVCPSAAADLETAAAREFLRWIDCLGAECRVMNAEQHDRIVALSSHLPQLLSTTLAEALASHPDADAIAGAAGPGLVDSTRLALSSWDIWRDILETNKPSIDAALDLFEAHLANARRQLSEGSLERSFESGRQFASRLRK
jgi:prephenate dehydrogenase